MVIWGKFFYKSVFKLNVIILVMVMLEDSVIEEKEPEVLERVTYGKTIFRLLNIDGDYQIEKRNPRGVINLIDYALIGDYIRGIYNSEVENAFERIRQSRSHVWQFDKEKQGLALQVDGLDLARLNSREPNLNKPIVSVSDKPMIFTIVSSIGFRSYLDFLTVDETV